MTRPTQALISVSALQHNLQVVRQVAPRSRIMAVIKADAYGHGVGVVAKALVQAGAEALAVASLEEAVMLRRQGVVTPIFLLEGPFAASDMAEIVHFQLGVVIHTSGQLAYLQNLPEAARIEVFVKVDTGMHRLGFPPAELSQALASLQQCPGVRVRGIMSHFARADAPEDDYNVAQIAHFHRVMAYLRDGFEYSFANSAAILRLPDSHYDWVRPGLMLYGLSPFPHQDGLSLGLRPVLQLRTAIIALRQLKAGDWLGYGDIFRAERPLRVGVVALGYGDGYPRALGTGAPALVGGQRTRLLGRVSMDMLFVDLSEIPQAQIGDEVVLMGEQGGERVTVEALADHLGTIPYELTCRIQGRVPRIAVA